MDPREQINTLVSQADDLLQKDKNEDALKVFQQALELAQKMEWHERIGQINQRISTAKQRIQEDRLRLDQKKELDKAQKLEMLKKKKEQEDKISNEAYSLLEKGTKAIQTNEFENGIKYYQEAIQKFKQINWVSEANRVQEIIKETQEKAVEFKKSQQNEKIIKPNALEFEANASLDKNNTEIMSPKPEIAILNKQLSPKKLDESKQKGDLAFNLIDQSNLHARNKEFEPALAKMREAQTIFKQIGWNKEAESLSNQIDRLSDEQRHYQLLSRKQEEETKKKEQSLKELEKEAELSRNLKQQKEKEEFERRKKLLENRERAKTIAEEVFKKIDQIELKVKTYDDAVKQGRMLVTESPFLEAIDVYQKAKQELREIGWTEEAKRLDDAIRNYQMRHAKDQQMRQMELKRITERQQQEEALKVQIESSQKSQQQKEAELRQHIQSERQKTKDSQKIQDECLDLLDKAKMLLDAKKYPEAIGIYQEVILKYEKIGWADGVRITKEALIKAQQDYQRNLREQQLNQKIQEEALKSQKDMEDRIKSSQIEEERKRTEMQRQFMEKKKKEEHDKKLNDELFQILEKASNDITNDNYDEALELYRRSLEIIRELDWTIKVQQINELITDAKNKKMAYLKKLKVIEEQRQKKEQEQKSFEEKLRKEEEAQKIEQTEHQKKVLMERQKASQEKNLSDAAWKLLDEAEKSIKNDNKYLGISFLHQGFRNFIQIGWTHEATIAKQRIIQIFELLTPKMIDQVELLSNENLQDEALLLELVANFELARKLKNFENAANYLKKIKELVQQLHWANTFNLIIAVDDAFQKEFDIWKEEQNSTKIVGPSPEIAAQLIIDAKMKVRENKFEDALELAKQASQIYSQLNMDREIKMINTEIALWKLKMDDFIEQQKNTVKNPVSQSETMSEEDKRKALIEERKRQRREERKKIRDE